MSDNNQEKENIGSVMDNPKGVDQSKRKFSKAGMAAPVIMTLASKPVFAVQGLSSMLSGNTSNHCHGDNKYGGLSHGFWMTPHGDTNTFTPFNLGWELAWLEISDFYGELLGDEAFILTYGALELTEKGNKWQHYINGTLVSSVFGTINKTYTGKEYPEGIDYGDLSLVAAMNLLNGVDNDFVQVIAGYLNMSLFESQAAGGESLYFLTREQFWGLYNGTGDWDIPEGYSSFADLIESNMHGMPTAECGEH